MNISSEIILLEQDGLTITKSYLLLHLHSLQAHASSTSFWHLGQASNYIEIQCHSMLTQIAGQSYERLRVHENGEMERQSHSDSACGSLSIPVHRNKRYSVKSRILPTRRMNKTNNKRKNSLLTMDLSKAARCGLKEQQVQFHTPHIVVQSSDFRIGQTVSLNCTMKASRPCAFLQWFLNHKPIAHSSLSSQHSNNGSLLTTNEYLFSRLLQSRASLHTGTNASTPIEDTYSSSTSEFSNNPLNPTFADSRTSTIYDHFAREDLTDQSLAIHFSVVKKHYQVCKKCINLHAKVMYIFFVTLNSICIYSIAVYKQYLHFLYSILAACSELICIDKLFRNCIFSYSYFALFSDAHAFFPFSKYIRKRCETTQNSFIYLIFEVYFLLLLTFYLFLENSIYFAISHVFCAHNIVAFSPIYFVIPLFLGVSSLICFFFASPFFYLPCEF